MQFSHAKIHFNKRKCSEKLGNKIFIKEKYKFYKELKNYILKNDTYDRFFKDHFD